MEEAINPEVITGEEVEIKKVSSDAVANIHNNLIQARHKYTLEEIRLMDTIISFISPEDEDFKLYKIPVSIFFDLYGTERKDIYDVVKRALNGLLSKPIKIERINQKGKRVFEVFNFINYGKYEEGSGNFYIKINEYFKPYLLQLKEYFSRIPIKYTYVLNSRYSIRLYELLKQYENTGYRIDYIEELREMLGVEKDEYKVFADFDKRVLKPAVEEINEKTDLKVSYYKKKTGKKITHIEFRIEVKPIPSTIYLKKTENITLWQDVLDKLIKDYNADKEDIGHLRRNCYAVYRTDTRPRQMIIETDRQNVRRILRGFIDMYWNKINAIVKELTDGKFEVVIGESLNVKNRYFI